MSFGAQDELMIFCLQIVSAFHSANFLAASESVSRWSHLEKERIALSSSLRWPQEYSAIGDTHCFLSNSQSPTPEEQSIWFVERNWRIITCFCYARVRKWALLPAIMSTSFPQTVCNLSLSFQRLSGWVLAFFWLWQSKQKISSGKPVGWHRWWAGGLWAQKSTASDPEQGLHSHCSIQGGERRASF